ncbi:CGNR zinc finger domain-containing protein [Pseudonocardia sp. TRM90224]|uniref:CGNR zinc finger domain-containing protein n=1 Tax=Pseudonocardia sp. TRM90224 TaxID=2812678 RepID=UPI001E2CF069|nr:CGNR zinc finger domain-containing protein [Pseudonocardia sp. TRM90224]
MDFIGYRSDALGAAVALVNALAELKADEPPVDDQMRTVLTAHGYLAGRAPKSAEPALRAWARRLRTVFDAPDLDAGAVAVNALLADVTVEPHLSGHDGQRWHLHYSPPEAGVVDRLRSTTAFALAMLVSEYGMDRHGRCAADGCTKVYADTSRNAARRYCSPACANRSAVAAHRARARARAQ